MWGNGSVRISSDDTAAAESHGSTKDKKYPNTDLFLKCFNKRAKLIYELSYEHLISISYG